MKKNKLILRNLETICTGVGLLGAGGFLTGAMLDNEKLALISGGAAIISAMGGLYLNNKQKNYDNSDNDYDNNSDNTLNKSNNNSYPNTDNYEVQ